MSEMNISSLDLGTQRGNWLDNLARSLVLRSLKKLPAARLLIKEGDRVHQFGEQGGGEDGSSDGLCATIIVHQPSAYRDFAFGGSVGAGEAYMQGSWSSPSLLNVVRVFARNIDALNSMEVKWPFLQRCIDKFLHTFKANTLTGSRRNIAAHYDLSNEFFGLFLDPSMMYSAAIYPQPSASLEQASIFKLETLCQKLQLQAGDHLLEIGTGWGGLAIYAAKNYGCRVTTTTLSKEQFQYAEAQIRAQGLEDKITLLLKDYRELEGQYDKLVSVEMIEAVGHEYYQEYFRVCSERLKADGLMVIQAITVTDQRYATAKASVDFIKKYIFPGGSLPSVTVMANCLARKTDLTITHLQDIGIDYADTLRDWYQRFSGNLPQVKALGFDDTFCRMWEFYLLYCEGGFRERAISTVQMVMAKPGARVE
ncbi:class I SAM-dependent methyltransferase [Pseudomaricurvus alcaniphilus]|uniref:SAM-dependent methyltransferase n=1 Tax=Pseudomaricurvus alcaniphilus TaxID=1166482 RepID=UPI0014084740|nr:cyclopropane-fatty-acyl-phospholipid synthase family protein [Pseudomaricurvus alcaniphilus]NHN36095.1 class I SAM-dependent methyltransferase [Pseudomaricurvus alcaniphilus]